ncbi:MAG: HD domain-containing protein [Anaerolineae bacterium]
MKVARVRHRVRQFFRTLQAPLRPVDLDYVAERLSPSLVALFRRMPRAEQHHGIDLCRALEAQGLRDPDVLAAALLHDVGKTVVTPRLWERVWVVLGEHFLPKQAEAWGRGEPASWRRGFVVRRCHPTWGAALAERAGASARVVELIRCHHDPPADDTALAVLQALDET